MAHAQAPSDEVSQQESQDDAAGWGVVPLPVFGLAPETGVVFGALGILHYQPDNLRLREQTLRTELIFSTTRMYNVITRSEVYFWEDRVFVGAGVAKRHLPLIFYGVGNDTSRADAEDYVLDSWEFDGTPMIAPVQNLFVGPAFVLRSENTSHLEPGGLLASGSIAGWNGGRDAGLGAAAKYDTRDNATNARQGERVAFEVRRHDGAFGSDFEYWRFDLQASKYFGIAVDHVLAVGLFGLASFGEPPFSGLGLLGGWKHLRGHYEGRYRDRWRFDAQAEYRVPIVWRLGAVLFAGVGDVAQSFDDFFSHGAKYSVGGGLRFLVDRPGRVNVSADWGYGGVGSGDFYVDAGEVF